MVDTVDTTNDTKWGGRFNLWFVLTAFSVVVLAAVTSDTTHENDRTRSQRWLIAVSSISLSLGALACLANAFARSRFLGTPIEGGLAVLCLGFWAAGLPSIMYPRNHIALVNYTQNPDSPDFVYALNANIYFFTWGAFIAALFLAGSFFQEVLEAQWTQRSFKRTMMWLGLCAASCVVMASASRTFHLANCEGSHSTFYNDSCERVKAAVSVGAITASFAIVMALLSYFKQLLIESMVAILLFIMWCFAVSYFTFGSKAIATNVGNLYFSTWFAFTFSLVVAADAVSELYCTMFCRDETTTTTTAAAKETPTAEAGGDKALEESSADPAIMEPSEDV